MRDVGPRYKAERAGGIGIPGRASMLVRELRQLNVEAQDPRQKELDETWVRDARHHASPSAMPDMGR